MPSELEAELKKELSYWQKKLRLQDWKIEANFCHAYTLQGDLGEANVFPKKKVAEILITYPDERDPNSVGGAELWQVTLIHELLHIVLDGIAPRDEPTPVEEEQAVNNLAIAFWQMKENA